MAHWIHLIFYRMLTYITGVLLVVSDFEKKENWEFEISFSLHFMSVLNLERCVQTYFSEMAGWIHLIFYSMMTHITGMILQKLKYWGFYIYIFCCIFVSFELRVVCSDSDLRACSMDSSDILQDDDPHHMKDSWLFRVCKNWT